MNFMENKARSASYDTSFRRNLFEICQRCILLFPEVEDFKTFFLGSNMEEIRNNLAKNIELLNIASKILMNVDHLLKEIDQNFFMPDDIFKKKLRIIDYLLDGSISILKRITGS